MKNNPLISRFSVAFKICFIYAAVLISLELLGQLAIQIREKNRPSPAMSEEILALDVPLIGFGLKRNLNLNMGRWTVNSNRWGFRGTDDLTKIKPENEIRVALVGGSTIFGWGVQDNETIPAHLQSIINTDSKTSGKQIRIINAGCPWYASWHEASLIYFRILEFQPDWIIVLDGLNDTSLSMSSSWTPIVDEYNDLPTRKLAERKQLKGAFDKSLSLLMTISPTFRYLYAWRKNKEEFKTGAYHPEVWQQYISYMTRVKRLMDSLDIKISFFFQPVMHIEKPLDYFEITHDGTSMARPEFRETFKKIYLEGEKLVLSEAMLNATSLKSVFNTTQETIYLDGLHYNAKGNKILAEKIYQLTIKPRFLSLLSPKALSKSF